MVRLVYDLYHKSVVYTYFYIGSRGSFTLHENTSVTAEFVCANGDFRHLYVSDLRTPIGTYPNSLLRATDIISIDFNMPTNLETDKLFTSIVKPTTEN
jgi:Gem-associated protein 7 (Gemin7)